MERQEQPADELTSRLLHRATIVRVVSILVSIGVLSFFELALQPTLERELGRVWSVTAQVSLAFLLLLLITRPLHLLLRESVHRVDEFIRKAHLESIEDPLTGLWNRRHLDSRLGEEFARARRHRHALSLILGDVDRFKSVNDQHGHPTGDEVLREAAAIIRRNVRREDIVARFGGDEFCILLPETDLGQAALKAEQMRQKISESIEVDGEPVTMSFGVAAFVRDDSDPTDLLRRADECLYDAKLHRNEVCVVSDGEAGEEEASLGPTN